MQVRSIQPSPYNGFQTNGKKQNTNHQPSFKAIVNIDRASFMKCKQNGYKLWNVASNLEAKLVKLPDEFEITFRGVREKFNSFLDIFYTKIKMI